MVLSSAILLKTSTVLQTRLQPFTPPKVDPVKYDLLEVAGALTQLTENLGTMYVKQGDKGDYVAIDHLVAVAFHSNIPKAAQAQYRSTPVSGGTRSQSEEYPAAYAATHTDMVFSGLYALSLPSSKEASHVTCTGVPFDPDNDELKIVFRTIWATPALLLNKAQTTMKSEIVDVFDTSIFPKLNKTFPGSDLLQKLWQYLFCLVYSNRSLILQHAEKWFLTSLATAADFHTAIFQFQAIQTCKNILAHSSPLETNPDTMLQLL